jgi:hypothetical protein
MDYIDEKMTRELDNLVSDTNIQQSTEMIRERKNSSKIRNCVNELIKIKKDYSRLSYERIEDIAKSRCHFLFVNFNNIFYKLLKDEIDLSLLFKFIAILEKIERSELNQHEASFQVGTILKKIYIDSSIKKNEKLDKVDKKKEKRVEKKLSNKLSFNEWNNNNNK